MGGLQPDLGVLKVIYFMLYFVVVLITIGYITGNMCASDLIQFPMLYETETEWQRKNLRTAVVTFYLGLFGPFGIMLYRLSYRPVTWAWTNLWSSEKGS